METSPPRSVAFFHPDLGIGGAERLVVDAAVGLKQRGFRVVIFTSHCDPKHCFDECRDGTLDVRVHGDWLPMSIFNRFTILCAILRHIYLLLHVALTGELWAVRPRAFIVDQLSAGLPLMRLLAPFTPILFYCHFPDLLLVRGRESLVKRLYRLPFDRLEEWSTAWAQVVAVNSHFTKRVVEDTWPRLRAGVDVEVVYPCVDTTQARPARGEDAPREKTFLSINRFERKKNVALAIRAYAAIPETDRQGVRLVLAGGYDPRVVENVEYHAELEDLASSLSLTHHTITKPDEASLSSAPADAAVLFLLSIPNSLKAALLRSALLLLYTPSNEHFGIVPLEAMLSRLPVLACNTGGPVETIRDSQTGWLRDPRDVGDWSAVMRRVLSMPDEELRLMGARGEDLVERNFGRDRLAQRLERLVYRIPARRPHVPPIFTGFVILIIGISVTFAYAPPILWTSQHE